MQANREFEKGAITSVTPPESRPIIPSCRREGRGLIWQTSVYDGGWRRRWARSLDADVVAGGEACQQVYLWSLCLSGLPFFACGGGTRMSDWLTG